MAANGIKQLMQAEEKAAQIVAEARKERNDKLKSARNEAMKEIENIRYSLLIITYKSYQVLTINEHIKYE